MKHKKFHITIIFTLLIWCCSSDLNVFFNTSEKIARKRIIVILLLFSFAISFAQKYTNYTTENGLPSNYIYTILQDAEGFIWFLTDKGMVKFNGKNFKVFTTKQGLPNNDAWDGFTTPDNKLWYLSKTSTLGYIENDSVFSFPNDDGKIMNPIFSSQVGNDVYPTGPTKMHKLIDGKWRVIFNKIKSNVREDRIQIIHNKINYLKLNTKTNTLDIINKNNEIIKQIAVYNLFKQLAVRGQITDSLFTWVSEKEYSILNLNTLKLTRCLFKDEIKLKTVKHARINLINNKLQITGTGFVGFLDNKLHIKDPFYFPNEIKSHFALIDKNNAIWFATFSNGVYKLPYSKRNIRYLLNNQKTGRLNVTDNEIYTTVFNKGFYKIDPETNQFNLFLKEEEFPFSVKEIKELNTMFLLSKYKLRYFKNGKLTTVDYQKLGEISNSLATQLIYHNTNLYSTFAFGINKLNTKNYTVEKEYLQAGCNYLLSFNNQLLIATNNGLKELKNNRIINVKLNNHDFNNPILSLNKISSSQFLINTDGFGSYISNINTLIQLPNSEFLTVENAFVENEIILLATNKGILKYTKNNGTYQLTKKINLNNGLPSNIINDVLIYKNKIVVSTNRGIAILPKEQENKSQFLTLYLESANYNNQKLIGNNLPLKYKNDNTITFSVASINFDENISEFTYNYKLSPVQKNWISTTSTKINFTNLPPNNYNLKLEAQGITKNYTFRITPLWHQYTISKIGIVLLILLFISFLLFKIRNKEIAKKTAKLNIQKQLAEHKLQALQSQMNPHFVFNSLNAIQYYITKNEIELSEKYLVRFSRLIRKFFDFSRDKFISLEQEISLLKNYLEIEKMRFGDGFIYEFNIDKTLKLSEQKIPTMLLQPIVENAVNHGLFHNGGKGLIKIEFLKDPLNYFIVKISDNGIGLKKAKEIKENSIKTHISKSSEIIQNRIDLLNQSKVWFITYSIKELQNSTGTIVQLTFKNNE